MNTEVKRSGSIKEGHGSPSQRKGKGSEEATFTLRMLQDANRGVVGQVWETAARRPATACSSEEKEKEAMAETRTPACETHLGLQLKQTPHLFGTQFPIHSMTVLRNRISCLQSITTGAAPRSHPFESGSPPCSYGHSPHPCLTPQYQPGISQKASLGEQQNSYLLESCSRILDLET